MCFPDTRLRLCVTILTRGTNSVSRFGTVAASAQTVVVNKFTDKEQMC